MDHSIVQPSSRSSQGESAHSELPLEPHDCYDISCYSDCFKAFVLELDMLEQLLLRIAVSGRALLTKGGHQTTHTLLIRGKALSRFLLKVDLLQEPPPIGRIMKHFQRAEQSWLSTSTLDLRFQLHRYSILVLQIAHRLQGGEQSLTHHTSSVSSNATDNSTAGEYSARIDFTTSSATTPSSTSAYVNLRQHYDNGACNSSENSFPTPLSGNEDNS
jgi:hypothetical protein